MDSAQSDVAYAEQLLGELGIPIERHLLDRMLAHLRWMLEANATVNLTAISEPQEAVRLHVVDSLAALGEVSAAVPGDLLDIGTGGGFPGVPLAIATQRKATLLDSVGKKSAALQGYLSKNEPEMRAVSDRAEIHAIHSPGAYAVIVARAVAPLASLVELASPLLMQHGRLVALKARAEAQELEDAVAAAAQCGMTLVSSRQLRLPVGGEDRTIFVFERSSEPAVTLPRRIGMAQKRPLGARK